MEIPKSVTIGGWLGGALQWHLTFVWIYIATGIFYLAYQFASDHYKRVLFTHRDIPGVWPMVRHYFFFRSKPALTEQYNPLQKQAYTSVILLGVLSLLTGLVLYNPVQFSFLAKIMGGFSFARILHFAVMCAFVFFIIGHLVMVVLHGWNNFVSMLTGWKRNPEYLLEYSLVTPNFSQASEEVRGEKMAEAKKEENEMKEEDKIEIVEDTKQGN